jgi:hypothetical protein
MRAVEPPRVLVIDDDPALLESLSVALLRAYRSACHRFGRGRLA